MMKPAECAAELNGQEIDFDAYRSLVGKSAYVSQQVRPWHASVRDCLRWAAPDASEDMMRSALADVGLDKRLGRSASGLDHTLQGSRRRFPGGELPRLLLEIGRGSCRERVWSTGS